MPVRTDTSHFGAQRSGFRMVGLLQDVKSEGAGETGCLADGFTPNPVGNTLGVWTLRNTESVTTGVGAPTFSITSATMNPSAAFTTLGSYAITIVAAGNAPHQSFSDAAPFFQARWGDYSWAVADPDNGGGWLATEYIPPPAFQAEIDNWGTDVLEVIRH